MKGRKLLAVDAARFDALLANLQTLIEAVDAAAKLATEPDTKGRLMVSELRSAIQEARKATLPILVDAMRGGMVARELSK